MATQRKVLSERFTLYGAFWDPDDVATKLVGTLTAAKKIEFSTSPVFKEGDLPFPSFEIIEPTKTPETLYGFTQDGICTLFSLHYLSAPGLTDYGINKSITAHRYRVDLCVFGLHIPSIKSDFIHSAGYTFTGINSWLPKADTATSTKEAIIHTIPYRSVKLVEIGSLAIKADIILEVFSLAESTPPEGSRLTISRPRVRIKTHAPRDVVWFYRQASRLENFFTLLLGSSVITETIELVVEQQIGWVTRRRRGHAAKVNLHHSIPCSQQELCKSLVAWLELPDTFQPIESLAIATIRNTNQVIEAEFLALAQALEALDRVTDSTTIIPKSEFKGLLSKAHELLKTVCEHSPIYQRFVDGLAHANEASFAVRLRRVVKILSEQQADALIGETTIFVRTVVDTRNKLTHPGIKAGKLSLTEPDEFFKINQKMQALLRLALLSQIGIAPNTAFEAVLNQATEWSV